MAEAFAVTDVHATPVLYYRMDGALLISVNLAIGKARGALWTQKNASGDLVAAKQPSSPFFTFDLTNDGLITLPGAFVLNNSAGQVIGALSCSGQYSAAVDVDICQAGYNAAPSTAITASAPTTITLNQALVAMQAALDAAHAANWSAYFF